MNIKNNFFLVVILMIFAFPTFVRADKHLLYNELINNSVLDNVESEFVTSPGIDFSEVSSDTNGKGLYMLSSSKDADFPIVYYRGNISNNNLVYAGFCWHIIRTTDTGGIKIQYAGVVNDGKCNNEKEALVIGKSQYNDTNDNKKYGWMYNLGDGDVNVEDSLAKKYLDNWFKDNMLDYVKELEDTVWCNDRTMENSVFDIRTRLENGKPTLECKNIDDRFTVFSSKGNKKLTYPTAIINADELTYAGEVLKKTQVDTFVNISYSYWSMSPYVLSKNMYPNSKGMLNMYTFTYNTGIRPMISLRNSAILIKGDGNKDNPYYVEIEKQYRIMTDDYTTSSKEESEATDTINFNHKERTGYKYIETKVYDLDDNELDLSVNNNSFVMPNKDIKLISTYRELKSFYDLTTDNDKISINESSVEEEQTATFSINVPHGYKVTSVVLKDDANNILNIQLNNDNNIYSFEMPGNNVIVDATFEELPKFDAEGESITIDNNEYYENDEVVFDVEEKTGYYVKEVYLVDMNGDRLDTPVETIDGKYSFEMPSEDVKIMVGYEAVSIPNPQTGDNIYKSVIMLLLSSFAFIYGIINLDKHLNRNRL